MKQQITPYPGYVDHVNAQLGIGEIHMTMEETQKRILGYTKKDDTTMVDRTIPGPEEGQEPTIRIITPGNVAKPAPIVVDIHGGGFVSGNLDIDNYRNLAIAEGTPCIVVSVEYRLTTHEVHFPAPLMDCHAAYLWVVEHAAEFGGDPDNIALHGTSAGGNLCAALALYLRDHGEPAPKLTVLNCPGLTVGTTISKLQFGTFEQEGTPYAEWCDAQYVNALGTTPSYYAMPSFCPNLAGLGPHCVILGEYDPLRSEGLDYATALLKAGVPCELTVAPRVTHGFCVIDAPLTHYIHKGICASLRREFGMEITEF